MTGESPSPVVAHARTGSQSHEMNHMKQLMREPLVHFLLLGAAIFAVYGLVSKGSSGEPGKIVITQGQLASMWEGFTATRQRTPTQEEWEGLIRARVREEVYYREALALGLDKDDTDHPPPPAAEDRVRLRRRGRPGRADRRRVECVSAGAPRRVSRGATVHLPPGVSQPGEARRTALRATPRSCSRS